MRAGFGIIDITPPLGVELAGYGYYLGRRCDSVRDRLFARAVLLESESGSQLIVSFDVLGISREIMDALFRAAATLEDCHGLLREYGVSMSDDILRRIREFPSLDLLLRLAGHR